MEGVFEAPLSQKDALSPTQSSFSDSGFAKFISMSAFYLRALFIIVTLASILSLLYLNSSHLPGGTHASTIASLPGRLQLSESSLRSSSTPTKYKGNIYPLCALTRVRNVAFMIPQWIEYHVIAGVDHFFIADDCSTDPSVHRILNAYQDLGIVTFLPFPRGKEFCENHVGNEGVLFNILFLEAKPKCEWVGIWDVDEYVASTDLAFFGNLFAYLNASVDPLVRLPWFIVGSEGLESGQGRLIVENYHHGYLLDGHIKTIGRSSAIKSWTYSLHPGGPESYTFNDSTLLKRYTSNGLFPDEVIETNDDHGRKCKLCRATFFLKHYMFMSWEEYMMGRGSWNRTSNNDKSPWAQKPREMWLIGQRPEVMTCVWAEKYSEKMAPLVNEVLEKRWGQKKSP